MASSLGAWLKRGPILKGSERSSDLFSASSLYRQGLRFKVKVALLFLLLGLNISGQASPLSPPTQAIKKNEAISWSSRYSIQSLEKQLTQILFNHYQAQITDPHYLRNDLIDLAHYFSQFPDAASILLSIEHLNWTLQYKPKTYQSVIEGSRLNVESATIYFDTRSAARLKFHRKCESKWNFCVASPADALLHELLHTQSALLSPNKFLAEGGLNGVIYPYIHEQKIIQKENKLYQAMSLLDGMQRPIRKNHVGRYYKAGCATCVQ